MKMRLLTQNNRVRVRIISYVENNKSQKSNSNSFNISSHFFIVYRATKIMIANETKKRKFSFSCESECSRHCFEDSSVDGRIYDVCNAIVFLSHRFTKFLDCFVDLKLTTVSHLKRRNS